MMVVLKWLAIGGGLFCVALILADASAHLRRTNRRTGTGQQEDSR